MPDLNTIPETKTADELAALKASDPAAFDLDATPADDATALADKAAAELVEKEAAEKAEADAAAAKAEADKAEEAKKSDVIPKGRFNEALRERDAERMRADALAAELEALKKGPAVDYSEEIKKLDAAWNSEGDDAFDGTHEQYLAKRDSLLVQKTEADAQAKFQKEQAERDVNAKLDAWDKDARSFVDANERYKDDAELARFNEALAIQFARNPSGTHAEWLTAADKLVQAMAIAEGRATPEVVTKGPHDDRNKADAQASAKASGAPKSIAGGVSSAGGPIGNIDMANLKPGQFSKLSKDQQAAALGSADAL